MPGANGEYVKIYLYLLRCLKSEPQELSISLIADKFDHTESDVCRALKYWEKMKLLKLDYDGSRNLTGVHILEGVSSGTAAEAPKEPEAPEALFSPVSYTHLHGSSSASPDSDKSHPRFRGTRSCSLR